MNLANLLNQLGRNAEAEKQLREVVRMEPGYGEGHYSLGLLLAEDPRRLGEALESLSRAVSLLPGHARAQYNYALALQHAGRAGEAESVLHKAHELDPRSPDIVNALVIYYMQRQQWRQAYDFAEKLAVLVPADPGVRQLLSQLQQRLILN